MWCGKMDGLKLRFLYGSGKFMVVIEEPTARDGFVRSGRVKVIVGEEEEELTIEQLSFMCDILKHEILKYHDEMRRIAEMAMKEELRGYG